MDYPDPHPDYDHPGYHPPTEEETLYPDIDETVQYPWQENQQTTADNSFDASLLDPWLYSDAVPETSQQAGQQVYDEDAHYADEYYQDQDEDDSADDSTYELSEEEDST